MHVNIHPYICACVCALSCPTLLTPWTIAHQAPLSMGLCLYTQTYIPRGWIRASWEKILALLRVTADIISYIRFSSVHSLSRAWLFVTPWTAAHQASLSITNSWSLLKLTFIKSVMPSNHLILCRPLLLLPLIYPSIRVFSNESGSSQQVAKVLEFQLQHQFFQWIFRTDLL